MIKKISCKLLLLSIFLPIFSFAQPVIIKGHVSAKKKDTLVLTSMKKIVDDFDYDKKEALVASASPDKNGNFRFVCQSTPNERYFDLAMGENGVFSQAYLYPGDSIFVEITDSDDHFYGNGASSAVFEDSCLHRVFYGISSAMKLSTDSFLHKMDSLEKVHLNYIEAYAKRNNWRPELKQVAIHCSKYFWKGEKLEYLTFHPFIMHQKGIVKVEPSYFNFITDSDLHNETALNTTGYAYSEVLDYLADYLVSEKWEHLPDDIKNNLKAAKDGWARKEEMKTIDSLYTGKIKEAAFGAYLESMFDKLSYDKKDEKTARLGIIDSILGALKKDSGTYHTGIYERFKEKRLNLVDRNNTPAPTFTLADTSGNTMSLSDFKGKVVFLDFWWVGCTPCIQAIPASNKLQEDFAGKDFVVISICCESPDKYWKYIIKKYKWHGIHLMGDMKIEDNYGLEGYPHYILIDKEGVIRHYDVRHENATFDDDFKTEITKLLEEK